MKIRFPSYIKSCNYYWYFLRSVYLTPGLEIEEIPGEPVFTQFVAPIFIDDKVIILDVRDDCSMPLPELKKYPDALIYKSNYSTELWDNPPATFEYPLTEEEKKFRNQVRPFIYGRALNIKYDVNEIEHFQNAIKPIKYGIISYSGEGIFKQQTENRLKVYDLIKSVHGQDAELVWFARSHFEDKDKIENYRQIIKPYLRKLDGMWGSYHHYLSFLSQGRFSLNLPGIACSQPFRLIDGVFANRAVLSTEVYTDIYKNFPYIHLPICVYFGTGDWETAKKTLEYLYGFDETKTLEEMKQWYNYYLSAKGLWENQILKGLTK